MKQQGGRHQRVGATWSYGPGSDLLEEESPIEQRRGPRTRLWNTSAFRWWVWEEERRLSEWPEKEENKEGSVTEARTGKYLVKEEATGCVIASESCELVWGINRAAWCVLRWQVLKAAVVVAVLASSCSPYPMNQTDEFYPLLGETPATWKVLFLLNFTVPDSKNRFPPCFPQSLLSMRNRNMRSPPQVGASLAWRKPTAQGCFLVITQVVLWDLRPLEGARDPGMNWGPVPQLWACLCWSQGQRTQDRGWWESSWTVHGQMFYEPQMTYKYMVSWFKRRKKRKQAPDITETLWRF